MGGQEVRGYYYFRPKGTPHYPGVSYFGSRNWIHNDGTPRPAFGEVEGVKQVWRNGSFPVRPPDAIAIGGEDCISGTGTEADTPPAQLLHGVDVRCWAAEALPAEITGDAMGVGDASARTHAQTSLTGDALGVGDATGETSAGHVIVGDALGEGAAIGETSAGHVIVGDALGVGDAHAETFSAQSIQGDATVKGDATGDLYAGHRLDADATGKGDATGDLYAGHRLDADATGKGDATGDLYAGHQIDADATGKGDGTAQGLTQILFTQSTNADTGCDVASVPKDLGFSIGSGTTSGTTSSASYVEVIGFDVKFTRASINVNVSLNVSAITAGGTFRFRVQAITAACAVAGSTAYSADFTTTGFKSLIGMGLSFSTATRLRLSVELKSSGGSKTVTVTNNGFSTVTVF